MTELLLKIFVKNYKNTNDINVRKRYGLLGSFFGLISNFILFVLKIVIGILLGFVSLIADSINNLSDFANNVLSIVGVKISSKKADREHPYGHQRFEYILSLIIGCVIISLATMMMYQAIIDGVDFFTTIVETSNVKTKNISYALYIISLSIMAFAILVKLSQMFLYVSLGKRIDSLPMVALAKDSRNDVISSFFVIVGLVISWFTSIDIDWVFSLIIAIFVITSGIGIIKDATSILLGKEPDKELINKIVKLINSHEISLGMHDLFLHYYGENIYGVIHVEVDDSIPINESHKAIDEIEKEAYEKLKIHLTIHMDPVKKGDYLTDCIKQIVIDSLNEYEIKGITIHDFRIEKKEKYFISFEVVLPEEEINEVDETKLNEYLIEKIRKKFNKDFILHLDFDSDVQDFLLGTDAEKYN